MRARILKWSNGQGLRLTKAMLAEACLAVGDDVELSVSDGRIIVAPARPVRGRYRLEALLAGRPDDAAGEEFDWGGPVGHEVW
jgi:antitoxin MazE